MFAWATAIGVQQGNGLMPSLPPKNANGDCQTVVQDSTPFNPQSQTQAPGLSSAIRQFSDLTAASQNCTEVQPEQFSRFTAKLYEGVFRRKAAEYQKLLDDEAVQR